MTIVERRCPRCAIKRTVQLAEWGGFCFNCRLQLDVPARVAEVASTAQREAPDQTAAYAFDAAELVRLERYRAAIQRRIYTDWPSTRHAGTVSGGPSSHQIACTNSATCWLCVNG